MRTLSGTFVLIAACAALTPIAITTGCLAVAAGAGAGATVAYMRGDLDATLGAGFDRSVRAANQAMEQLQFPKISEKKDAISAIIIARTAADRRIELRIDSISGDATKLKVRVGAFGDDTLNVTILEKIKSNL